jgi:hypothetical protein
MSRPVLIALLLATTTAQAAEPAPTETMPVAAFLQLYNSLLSGLYRVANEAAWLASTDVGEAHEAGRTVAGTAPAVFQGESIKADAQWFQGAPRARARLLLLVVFT